MVEADKMSTKVRTFQDLKVWQKAHYLVLETYRLTKSFPNEEKFGLVTQIRRSSSSVATNIVEGHKRRSRKEFLHFLNLAESSLEETKYHLILSRDLSYITEQSFLDIHERCEEIGRMLHSFQKRLIA